MSTIRLKTILPAFYNGKHVGNYYAEVDDAGVVTICDSRGSGRWRYDADSLGSDDVLAIDYGSDWVVTNMRQLRRELLTVGYLYKEWKHG